MLWRNMNELIKTRKLLIWVHLTIRLSKQTLLFCSNDLVIYRALDQHKTFSEGELFDSAMDIRLPIGEIFE